MQTLEDDDAVIELLEDSGASESAANGQELVTKKMIKEERFCNLFGLSLNEKIIKSFPCFLVAEILIQGTMVVTERHICFYSNIPGLKRIVKIRFADVVRITKEKVYAFFPTGIGVHSRKEKTVFSYVTSRDKLLHLLRTQWESYSEVDEDFCSSARGSSADEAPMDGQASSRDVSVLNDEDSGILVAPTVATASSATSADSSPMADSRPIVAEEEESLDLLNGDLVDHRHAASASTASIASVCDGVNGSGVGGAFAAVPAAAGWRSCGWRLWKAALADLDSLPNKHAISAIAFLVLICAIVIVYLSYRLNSLQQQLLLVVTTRASPSQSEVDHLHHRLGGIVETLGGLQEKLGSLRHILQGMQPVDKP